MFTDYFLHFLKVMDRVAPTTTSSSAINHTFPSTRQWRYGDAGHKSLDSSNLCQCQLTLAAPETLTRSGKVFRYRFLVMVLFSILLSSVFLDRTRFRALQSLAL
uniref:Uncharacterized protein n=1 Tax=Anopheles culicifacies TaxID=139723 RepID=A0A182MD48_9DIPT